MRLLTLLPLVSCLLAFPAAAQTWLFQSSQVLPSTDTAWGDIAFDAMNHRLYAARLDDGLLVWNVDTKAAQTLSDTKGAHSVVLVPETDRVFVAMEDGSVRLFELGSLKPVGQQALGSGPVARGFFEPTQQRVHMVTGGRPDKTTWVSLDASTGAVVGHTEFNSRTMDAPVTDGKGAIYAPLKDRGLLQLLDAKDLSLQKTWKLGDCVDPAELEWDAAAERVLVACRGDKPVFVALSPEKGVVSTVPIGRGAGGIILDPARRLIVTANGQDGTMTVIRQNTPDNYTLVETIATRPMARDLVRDPASDRLFGVTAGYTVPAPEKDGKQSPVFYHPDSFAILTWRAVTAP